MYAIFICLPVNIIHLKHTINLNKAFIDFSIYYKFVNFIKIYNIIIYIKFVTTII